MSKPRRFDWDEARRLRAEGLTYKQIADRFGVSPQAVARACDERLRARAAASTAVWMAAGVCPVCGGPSTRGYRCRACWAVAQATSVRQDSLRCVTCREWKPDEDFYRNADEPARRGCHTQCKTCSNASRTAWRRRNREAENAGAHERRRRAGQAP